MLQDAFGAVRVCAGAVSSRDVINVVISMWSHDYHMRMRGAKVLALFIGIYRSSFDFLGFIRLHFVGTTHFDLKNPRPFFLLRSLMLFLELQSYTEILREKLHSNNTVSRGVFDLIKKVQVLSAG